MLGIRRREFITLLGGAAVWPLAARAQQGDRVRRIGVLGLPGEGRQQFTTFQHELRELGWVEGRNVRFERRLPPQDGIPVHAAELVALAPDVIVTGSGPATTTVSQLTRAIPIVFVALSDPLGTGLVANMARPGGNITGFLSYEFPIADKWLELLKEIVPGLSRVALIYTQGGTGSVGLLHTIEALAPSFGVRTTSIPAGDPLQIERALGAFSGEPNSGGVVLTGAGVVANLEQIIAAAARHRLPAIYPDRSSVMLSGLMSYGTDRIDIYRRAASYVDRILRGEKPGDLPVQAPTKYELVINLKTAKELGLTVPPTLFAFANEVIE
jgi:putative tryptophan/tyrosine transport system substrate-binding protein